MSFRELIIIVGLCTALALTSAALVVTYAHLAETRRALFWCVSRSLVALKRRGVPPRKALQLVAPDLADALARAALAQAAREDVP